MWMLVEDLIVICSVVDFLFWMKVQSSYIFSFFLKKLCNWAKHRLRKGKLTEDSEKCVLEELQELFFSLNLSIRYMVIFSSLFAAVYRGVEKIYERWLHCIVGRGGLWRGYATIFSTRHIKGRRMVVCSRFSWAYWHLPLQLWNWGLTMGSFCFDYTVLFLWWFIFQSRMIMVVSSVTFGYGSSISLNCLLFLSRKPQLPIGE